MKVAAAHSCGVAVVAGVSWVPTYKWMSWSRNGVETLLVPPWQYSSGTSRKNKAIQERLAMACWRLVPPCDVAFRVWRTEIGSG